MFADAVVGSAGARVAWTDSVSTVGKVCISSEDTVSLGEDDVEDDVVGATAAAVAWKDCVSIVGKCCIKFVDTMVSLEDDVG